MPQRYPMTAEPTPTADELRAAFDAPEPMTLGLEEELMLLDPETLDLLPRARRAGRRRRRRALQARDAGRAARARACRRSAACRRRSPRSRPRGATSPRPPRRSAGSPPPACTRSRTRSGELNEDPRYAFTEREYGEIARLQLVCALQVHVAVGGADRSLAVYNALRPWLPLVAALAANAPFHDGRDTGMASIRPKIAEQLPRQGIPPAIASWESFADALAWGAASGLVPDARRWWWELRPHPAFGTLEVRVPDAQATVADAAAVAALVHALAGWLAARHDAGEPLETADIWRLEENRWSAARWGMDAELADLAHGRAHARARVPRGAAGASSRRSPPSSAAPPSWRPPRRWASATAQPASARSPRSRRHPRRRRLARGRLRVTYVTAGGRTPRPPWEARRATMNALPHPARRHDDGAARRAPRTRRTSSRRSRSRGTPTRSPTRTSSSRSTSATSCTTAACPASTSAGSGRRRCSRSAKRSRRRSSTRSEPPSDRVGEPPAPERFDVALRAIEARTTARRSRSYVERHATLEQVEEFLIHRSAYQLKEADPHSWAIARLSGAPKAALVEIQADEYGGGRAERIHAQLFADAMDALGLDSRYGAYLDVIPAQTLATVNLMSLCGLHRRLRGAIAGHLALFEMTSSIPNRRYAERAAPARRRRPGGDRRSSTSTSRPTRCTRRSRPSTSPAASPAPSRSWRATSSGAPAR